jgi:ubiquinol-cytochrome c reductase cytochrome c subunit
MRGARRLLVRVVLGPPAGRRRVPRVVRGALAVICAAGALFLLASPAPGQDPGVTNPQRPPEGDLPLASAPGVEPDRRQLAEGRRLFVDGCSTCHGFDARGIPGRAPSLHGVGALSADFYLRTGRMPLDDPQDEPQRHDQFYSRPQQDALIAYIGSLGGPPIPAPSPQKGDLAKGQRLFADSCAGCHQIVARGGITTRAVIPDLEGVEPVDVYEAMNIGPYVMPTFNWMTPAEMDSVARYVMWTHDPADMGGWGIGHIGPVPEGLVTFFIALMALLLAIRTIGERTTE